MGNSANQHHTGTVAVTVHWVSGRTTLVRRTPEFAAHLAHCLVIDQYPDINRIEVTTPEPMHTISFAGPKGEWTTTCDTPLAAANEVAAELQLGNATAAHIQPAA